MADYKEKLGGLANKLKIEQPKTPLQEVKPVKTSLDSKEEASQLNVWIPKALLKKMKLAALEKDISLKDLTIKALEEYLK